MGHHHPGPNFASALDVHRLRNAPFRLFFPLGVLVAIASVLPWLLFGRGWISTWMGELHALSMTQSFFLSLAIGFLGTMLPRRSGKPPLSAAELLAMAAGIVALPVALFFAMSALAQVAYLVVVATLLRFVWRRLPDSPSSLILIPLSLAAGLVGSVLLLAGSFRWAPVWPLELGRQLVGQGVLFGLVLAIAPLLMPIVCHTRPTASDRQRESGGLYVLVAVAFFTSFVIEQWLSQTAGLLFRAALLLASLAWFSRAWRPVSKSGLHRGWFRLALLLTPVGVFAAGLSPVRRVTLLHFSFLGGIALLLFAVSVHVTFFHSGREAQASRWPWPVLVAGVSMIGAAIVRSYLEWFPQFYFAGLTLAAGLFLFGAVIWMAIVLAPLGGRQGQTTPVNTPAELIHIKHA